ncbi:MAG: rpsT [Gemmataceae bacterium]|nr:rpsT [Gemmataceae bacterium]
MPHTPSAWKRLRKTEKRRKQNRTVAKTLKTKRKAVDAALKTGDAAKVGEGYKTTQAALDRAADRGYIHPNKAARLKSRLTKRIKAAASKPAAPAKG